MQQLTKLIEKTYSITFQRDVLVFSYTKSGRLISTQELTYKKFWALGLTEFNFKIDSTDSTCKRLEKVRKAGYTYDFTDSLTYPFKAEKV